MFRATGKKSESETALAKAIRDWAEHQDLSQQDNRQYKRRVDALLADILERHGRERPEGKAACAR